MKVVTRKQKQPIFTVLIVLMLFASLIIQQQVRGFMLPDFYDLPTVAPTWRNAPEQWLANHKRFGRYEKTGMSFNSSIYYANKGWPLGAVMYLQARDGYENPEEFKKFEGRHTYCTGNHQSAVEITPGARAFCSGRYRIGEELFEDAVKDKLNPEFNFLLLAIACDYPGDSKVKDNTWSSYEDPEAASDAVVQLIAWMATDQGSDGFTGESFEQDFQTFKKTYYDLLMTSFVEQPEMDDWLKAEPEPGPQVEQYGLANRADSVFYDIWCAAVFTAQLTPTGIHRLPRLPHP